MIQVQSNHYLKRNKDLQMFKIIKILTALLYTQYNNITQVTESIFDTAIPLGLLYQYLINPGHSLHAREV